MKEVSRNEYLTRFVPWHDDDGILTISLTDFLLKPEALDW